MMARRSAEVAVVEKAQLLPQSSWSRTGWIHPGHFVRASKDSCVGSCCKWKEMILSDSGAKRSRGAEFCETSTVYPLSRDVREPKFADVFTGLPMIYM